MRPEGRSLLVHLAFGRETEHLIAAAIGQDGPASSDEPMKPSQTGDAIGAGPEIQMIGIRENHLGADLFEIARRHRFDRALCANGHERRCLHDAVRRVEFAASSPSIRVQDPEHARALYISQGEETSRWCDLWRSIRGT